MRQPQTTILAVAVIVTCVFATFGPIVQHEFVYWDDHRTLFQNPDFNPPTVGRVVSYCAKEKDDLYIPATYMVWGVLAGVSHVTTGSLDPAVFHGASVALHAIAGCLAFGVLRELTRSDLAACAGALLFALHPVQVESVAWASGMKDVLCGVLSIAAVWQYLMFARSEDPRRARQHYVLATLAYVLAMLSKPSAVTVPLVAACLDYFLVRRDAVQLMKPLGAWVCLAFPIFIVTKAAQPAEYLATVPLHVRPLVAWDALAWYLRHVLMPHPLTLDYGRMPQNLLPATATTIVWWVIATIAAVGGLGLQRRWPWAVAAMCVSAAALAPVLGVVRFDFQLYSTVADHYLYVAMLGPALVVAGWVATASRMRITAVVLVAIAIVAAGITSFDQTRHWRNSDALFAHALDVNPDSFAAHRMLGFLARERGDNVLASVHYANALAIYPQDPVANFNLANALVDRGEIGAALEHFARAVKAQPNEPVMRNNYAVALARVGKFDDAQVELEQILARFPDYSDAASNLVKVRARRAASQPSSKPSTQPAA